VDGQIGLEGTPDAYVAEMVDLFREVWRVLADNGTLWLNIGDSYVADSYVRERGIQTFQSGADTANEGWLAADRAESGKARKNLSWASSAGLKKKDLIGIPWRVAFALQADGWYLRSDIIWHKPNPMPESVTDRPTKSHEYLFLLTKSPRYYYDHEAIKEPSSTGAWDAMPPIGGVKQTEGNENRTYSGNTPASDGKRNKRDVWTINTKPFKGAHFAVMPEALVEPCVLAGSAEGDTVLDPFTGSGTVAVVANRHGRNFVGTELNAEYAEIARHRITDDSPLFNDVTVIP
jgi:DNA modification methylase